MTEPSSWPRLEAALGEVLGRPVDLDGYGERLMGELEPNEPLLDYYRAPARRARHPARDPHQQRARVARRVAARGCASTSCSSSSWTPRSRACASPSRRSTRSRSSGSGCRPTRARSSTTSRSTSTAAREAGMHAIHFRDTDAGDRGAGRASCLSPAGPRRRARGTRPAAPSRARARATAARSPAPAPRPRRPRTRPRRAGPRRSSAPRAGSPPAILNAPTRKSLFASGVPTSIDACQAASIERSCSSRSATALA